MISFAQRVKNRIRRYLNPDPFPHLRGRVVELNNIQELKKLFGWSNDPIIDDDYFSGFDGLLDVNERRLRDAESLSVIARNCNPAVCLEIGTAYGHSTALLAGNAPASRIYTLNIPPEEIASGEGGKATTVAIDREQIGSYYRQRGFTNITQIYANSARWTPDIGQIDLAFIDGCHDMEFVYNDTRKVLPYMKPGGFIVWHDFSLAWAPMSYWVGDICRAVNRLMADGLITGYVYHVRDSWMGVHQVKGA